MAGQAQWIADFMTDVFENPPSDHEVTRRTNGKYPGLAVKRERRLIIDFYAHDSYIRGGLWRVTDGEKNALKKWPGVELREPQRAKYTTIYVRSSEGLKAIRSLF